MSIKRFSINRIFSNLFFFFFTAQIFSPFFFGVTIYLEFIFALLTPGYQKWVLNHRMSPTLQKPLIIFTCTAIALLKIGVVIKILFSVVIISYLFYAYQKNLFYLRRYMFLGIFVGCIQFVAYYINPAFMMIIGPKSLSHLVWGVHATGTNSNFYDAYIGGLVKVSGLCRETGFFASLMVAYIFLRYFEVKTLKKPIKKKDILLLTIGFVISFSKMSLVLIALLFCYHFRCYIKKIPKQFAFIFFFLALYFYFHENPKILDPANDTFMHRFGGFAVIDNVSFFSLLFGNNEVRDMDITGPKEVTNMVEYIGGKYQVFTGIAGFMLHYGLFLFIAYFSCLFYSKVKTMGLCILLLLTLATDPLTNQNFVMLTYFIVYKFFRVRRLKMIPANDNVKDDIH